jgi:hypothetical protein
VGDDFVLPVTAEADNYLDPGGQNPNRGYP